MFLTASGSRRSYYLLPILPFAALAIACWMRRETQGGAIERTAAWTVAIASVLMIGWFGGAVPAGFHRGGERVLAKAVRAAANPIAPWRDWHVVICGAPPAAGFYFSTATEAIVVPAEEAEAVRPIVSRNPHSVILTKRRFADRLRAEFPSALVIEEASRIPRWFRPKQPSDRDLIALVL